MNYFKIDIKGNSMSPLIIEGDEITFTKESGINLGDIVLFKDETSEYIAHRVISLNPLETKGDNSTCSENISKLQIFGKAVSINKRRVDISLSGKSPWMKLYALISKLRKNNKFLRFISILLMHSLTIIFQIIYSRPKKHRI
jgi:signal peptidase I